MVSKVHIFYCKCPLVSVLECNAEYNVLILNYTKLNKTPWPESERKLCRPSDRSLSAKLVPTFVDRVCHVVSDGSLRPYSQIYRLELLLFTRLTRPQWRSLSIYEYKDNKTFVP
jgi:hypothetical protein